MKTKIFAFALMVALMLTAAVGTVAQAQDPTCYDAAGSPIPCPPTDAPPGGDGGNSDSNDEEEENNNGGGSQNPPVVPTATATPLPIALPESDYLGSCNSSTGNLKDCLDQFTCEDGTLVIKVDIYTGGNGTQYDVYCIPHETLPTLDLPFSIPADDGATDDTNWTSGCFGDDVDGCIENLAALCDADGGDFSVWYEDDGSAGAYCENSTPADSQPAPTEAPAAIAAAPEDDGSTEGSSWDEECGYWTCWMSSLSCLADGGTGYELDHASGAHIYHCDVPSSEGQASPPSPWTPWITVGALAILIGLLLPAVQKVREAAARTRAESHATKIDLINKDNDGTEASDYLLEIDGIKGESKQHIKKATLTVRKAGNDHQEYYK